MTLPKRQCSLGGGAMCPGCRTRMDRFTYSSGKVDFIDICPACRSRSGKFKPASNVRCGKGAGYVWLCEHRAHHGEACLLWPFSKNENGYGMLGHEGKTRKARSLMCELAHGPKPTSKHRAGATCGPNHSCVHPAHLKWMTPVEIRRVSEGFGSHFGKERGAPGTKLTEQDVAQIHTLKHEKAQAQLGLISAWRRAPLAMSSRARHGLRGAKPYGAFVRAIITIQAFRDACYAHLS